MSLRNTNSRLLIGGELPDVDDSESLDIEEEISPPVRRSIPGPKTYQKSAIALLGTADWRNYELSFGRYNGKELREVPRSYIRWLLTCDTADLSILAVRRAIVAGGYKSSDFSPESQSAKQRRLNAEFADHFLG